MKSHYRKLEALSKIAILKLLVVYGNTFFLESKQYINDIKIK